GKPNEFNRKINIVHPEIETLENHQSSPQGFYPVYPSSEKLQKKGITNRVMQKIQWQLWEELKSVEENLSKEIIEKFRFPSRFQAYRQIHFPQNSRELSEAEKRLKFEEFFFLQLSLLIKKAVHQKYKTNQYTDVGDLYNPSYNRHLLLSLTNAQKKVTKEIRADVNKNVQMSRLLQGDVGSGNTIVALLAMLIAADNGFQ